MAALVQSFDSQVLVCLHQSDPLITAYRFFEHPTVLSLNGKVIAAAHPYLE